MNRPTGVTLTCDFCNSGYEKFEWDGEGEPKTYDMLEFERDKETEKLFHFCSKECLERFEEANPIN
ncbi:hypothetical protein LCGC14_0387670 [marine sediment metagenome]|uniref:TRASH domain-containing protein n=1 Tax=marine sediment metagenome TaxID=412755 RepID=A0A0F9T0G8_9ZZZZ